MKFAFSNRIFNRFFKLCNWIGNSTGFPSLVISWPFGVLCQRLTNCLNAEYTCVSICWYIFLYIEKTSKWKTIFKETSCILRDPASCSHILKSCGIRQIDWRICLTYSKFTSNVFQCKPDRIQFISLISDTKIVSMLSLLLSDLNPLTDSCYIALKKGCPVCVLVKWKWLLCVSSTYIVQTCLHFRFMIILPVSKGVDWKYFLIYQFMKYILL